MGMFHTKLDVEIGFLRFPDGTILQTYSKLNLAVKYIKYKLFLYVINSELMQKSIH